VSVFVDTSALLAMVNVDDERHVEAVAGFSGFTDDEALLTTNYVVIETIALVQRRLGMAALATLRHDVLGALDVRWVDPLLHEEAFDAIEAQGHRLVSLVDYVSFRFMRKVKVRTAFAFDDDFSRAGFNVVPPAPGTAAVSDEAAGKWRP
jgi:predicted nucleic acid-binding protein